MIVNNKGSSEYLEVSDIVSNSIDTDKLKNSILLELQKQTDRYVNNKILKATTVNSLFNKI